MLCCKVCWLLEYNKRISIVMHNVKEYIVLYSHLTCHIVALVPDKKHFKLDKYIKNVPHLK